MPVINFQATRLRSLAAKAEQRLRLRTAGYEKRHAQLSQALCSAGASLRTAQRDLSCFQSLAGAEARAVVRRRRAVTKELDAAAALEANLQAQFGVSQKA